jgi:hypothetical protein
VNQNSLRNLQLNLSGAGCWLTLFATLLLLGSIGLGWLVKSFLLLLALLIIAPIVAFLGFRWWLQRNLISGDCPVCSYDLTAVNGMDFQCPNCGEALQATEGQFLRQTPPGTIDVEVIEVPSRQLGEADE